MIPAINLTEIIKETFEITINVSLYIEKCSFNYRVKIERKIHYYKSNITVAQTYISNACTQTLIYNTYEHTHAGININTHVCTHIYTYIYTYIHKYTRVGTVHKCLRANGT